MKKYVLSVFIWDTDKGLNIVGEHFNNVTGESILKNTLEQDLFQVMVHPEFTLKQVNKEYL